MLDLTRRSHYVGLVRKLSGTIMDEKAASRETTLVTVKVRRDLADRVAEYAASGQQTEDEIVEQALGERIAWEEEKYRRTLEGLADVDAGRVVPDEEVRRWIESLGTDNPLPQPKPA